MALAVAMERFLAKHLGGRAQQEVPADLAAHLTGITVDPATVKLDKGPDAATLAQAKTGALPAADGNLVKPATLEYGVHMKSGGQSRDMSLRRTIEESKRDSRQCWKLTDAINVGTATMTSTFDVDRRSLEPIQFESSGMTTVKLTYSPKSITGEMGGGGQTMPVNQALEAPVLGGGAAFDIVLSGLPLVRGYQTTYRVFEAQMQRVRPMSLAVKGIETVTTKAGSFETLVVEVEPLDGDDAGKATFHVTSTAPHHVVTSSTKLAAMMGGGTLKTELTSVASGDKVSSR